MKLSRRWLEDYIDLNGIEDHELMNRLTMSTAEVEEIVRIGEHFDHIVTARITAIGQHPNADKIRLATVEYGAGEPLQVVCGAPNIEVGQIVPLATVGTPMPGGVLKEATIRGFKSTGMLCSEREMGMSDDHGGIMVLPEDTPLGVPPAGNCGLFRCGDRHRQQKHHQPPGPVGPCGVFPRAFRHLRPPPIPMHRMRSFRRGGMTPDRRTRCASATRPRRYAPGTAPWW